MTFKLKIMDKQRIGQYGESLAKKYLEEKKFFILTSNFHTRYGEIDIIAVKNNILHFVEVKTRTNLAFGWPEEAVTEQKVEKMISAAGDYIRNNNFNIDWQIDIIAILINRRQKTASIDYFENIS